MGYSDTPFADGSAMTRSAVTTELNTMRSWLNGGIVNGDLENDCVQYENIAPPIVLGFPSNSFEGETQSLSGESRHDDGERMYANVTREGEAAYRCNKTDRFDIFLDMVDDQTVPIIGAAKTVHIPAAGRVIVHAQINVEQADTNDPARNVAGNHACGYFALARAVRSYGSGTSLAETELTSTRRKIRYHRTPTHIHMIGEWNITSKFGENDFYVLYNKGTAATGTNTHIAVGYRAIRVEYEPA